MKKAICYVDAAEFERVEADFPGLVKVQQKGFVKVSGAKGRQVYVASTKRVGRVDISGFTVKLPGVMDIDPDVRPTGNVQQGIDFTIREDATEEQLAARRTAIIETYRAVLEHLSSLPPVETKAKAAAKARGPQPQGRTVALPKAPAKAPKEARKEAIAEAAKKAGTEKRA